MKNRLVAFLKPKLPLCLGLPFFCVVMFAHFSNGDSVADNPSASNPLPTANSTLERLQKIVVEENLNPTHAADSAAAPQTSVDDSRGKKVGLVGSFHRLLQVFGFHQNWRMAQSPAPEIQGFEIRAYHKTIKPMTGVSRTVFSVCAELDNTGECAPDIESRLEFETLKGIERSKSVILMSAFADHVIERASKDFSEEYRKVELIAFRHALKTTRDYSKRANSQILFAKDL